jgi:hypothetical protein
MSNEAILLMYLAEELSPEDRAEVEQMLATDAAMRRELEILRQTQQLAYDALRTLDSTAHFIPRMVTLGRVSELIHQWTQKRQQPAPAGEARLALPWWRISLSVAATLLVGYYIWAAYTYHPALRNTPMAYQSETSPDLDEPSDVPRARDLTPQEKVAILASSLEDSSSDDANLRIAEVAAGSPSDSSDQNAAGEP